MPVRDALKRLLHLDRDKREILAAIDRLSPWFFSFDLGDGIRTPLWADWLAPAHETRFRMILPDLETIFAGRWHEVTCLDVGCNEGYWAFEIAKRGVKQSLGFDARRVNIEKAEFVNARLRMPNVAFHVGDVTELRPDSYGLFDLTLCLGLLYHVENPMDVLRRLRAVTREVCVIDTQVLKPTAPVSAIWGPKVEETSGVLGILSEGERCDWNPLASTKSISLVPNRSALLTMLRHAGFSHARELPPYEGCFDQYASYDRVIVLAQ